MASSSISADLPPQSSPGGALKVRFWKDWPGIVGGQLFQSAISMVAPFLFVAPFTNDNSVLILLGLLGVLFMLFVAALIARTKTPLSVALGFTGLVLLLSGLSMYWLAYANTVAPIAITITSPAADSTSKYMASVAGRVEDPNAQVFVFVQANESPGFWPQPASAVESTGDWKANAYLGEQRNGNGQKFDVIAIATHENVLAAFLGGRRFEVGKKLDRLPSGLGPSTKMVTVTRQD